MYYKGFWQRDTVYLTWCCHEAAASLPSGDADGVSRLALPVCRRVA